jgi:hypothetical protein
MILSWQQHRATLRVPPALDRWLFPSPLLRARQSRGHLTPSAVARVFKAWTAQTGVIDSELPGPGGTLAPFDPSLITPYALRHSYAQRHAGAGVPVDVLKELMDHKSVTTTMGYYRISLKRRQQTIRAVAQLATGAAGNPAPFASTTAYERASVAVPFGNCTEPSSVTAGGGACPIRFQCVGCGFYRPDPSCLPAIEQHIAGLRADRETARAMDAAGSVLDSLTAEIDAFTRVAEAMGRKLSQMDPAQRAEIEEASRILRRARAGGGTLPLIPQPLPPRRPHDRPRPRPGHAGRPRRSQPGQTAARPGRRAGPRNCRDAGHPGRGCRRRPGICLADLRRRRPRSRRGCPAPPGRAPARARAGRPAAPRRPPCAPTSPSRGRRSAGSAPSTTSSAAGSGSSSAPKSKDPTGPR